MSAKKKEFKVISPFTDKNTFEKYGTGDLYEADVKRLKELQHKGFIEEVKDESDESGSV